MPARRLPTSFTVRKAMTINGTPYAVGASVTAHNVRLGLGAGLAKFVNRGWLRPVPTQYPETAHRTGQLRTTPTFYLTPQEFLQL